MEEDAEHTRDDVAVSTRRRIMTLLPRTSMSDTVKGWNPRSSIAEEIGIAKGLATAFDRDAQFWWRL